MARLEVNFDPVQAIITGCKQATKSLAESVLTASQREVPVATGKLKLSGEVIETEQGYSVRYSALGDNGYDYAVRQHNDKTLNHPNGGKDHFLSDPAFRILNMHNISERVLAEIRELRR